MRRTLRRIYKAANAQRAHTPSQAPPVVVSISPSIGSPNVDTAVTITGTGFTGATDMEVTGIFSGSGFTVVNDTTITTTFAASAPAGSTAEILITGPGGDSTGGTGLFSIPLAGIDSITPSSGTHLGGTAIAVAGWGFVDQNPTDFKLGGVSTTIEVYTDDNNATAVTGAHTAGAVTATVVCDAGSLTTAVNVFIYT